MGCRIYEAGKQSKVVVCYIPANVRETVIRFSESQEVGIVFEKVPHGFALNFDAGVPDLLRRQILGTNGIFDFLRLPAMNAVHR